MALLYAREGADVAIVYLPEEESDAKKIKGEIDSLGRRVLLLPGDLRDPDFCGETVRRTVEELGGLNILVSNAAYLNSQTEPEQLTSEDFDRVFKTNVYAYFHLVTAAVPDMSQGNGIIATASEEALDESDLVMDYAASKAAVVVFTKSIAPHLVKRAIRANVVGPGPTWSAPNPAGQRFTDDYLTNLGAQTPLGQGPSPKRSRRPTSTTSATRSSYTIGVTIAATGEYTDSR
ncbi:SDR family oxidoreductase [Streptomyces pratensis]|uniref:SDR family oxidoreductase n=1 Tax=Streptomyces pratensis TaxID=1169025 RepID=UPI001EE42ACE|nr:SDR family oxidoreductase [Streptomyces pratensis]